MTRVLVVDDHRPFAEAVASALEREAGLRVVAVTGDGLEAIGLADRVFPNAAVVDLALPGADGLAVTRALVSRTPPVRVVVLTSRDDARVRDSVRRAGAVACLTKGVAIEEVLAALWP